MPAIDNAYAFVIGIADYANVRKLPKVQDAQDLAAASRRSHTLRL